MSDAVRPFHSLFGDVCRQYTSGYKMGEDGQIVTLGIRPHRPQTGLRLYPGRSGCARSLEDSGRTFPRVTEEEGGVPGQRGKARLVLRIILAIYLLKVMEMKLCKRSRFQRT